MIDDWSRIETLVGARVVRLESGGALRREVVGAPPLPDLECIAETEDGREFELIQWSVDFNPPRTFVYSAVEARLIRKAQRPDLFALPEMQRNALANAGIKTLEDLLAADPVLFTMKPPIDGGGGRIRGLGKTGVAMVNDLLRAHGHAPKTGRRVESSPLLLGRARLSEEERALLSVAAVAASAEVRHLLDIIARLTGEKVRPADESPLRRSA